MLVRYDGGILPWRRVLCVCNHSQSMSGGAIDDAADLRLDGQDTKTAAARFALRQTGQLRVGRYEKSDASGLRPIYKV